jgi:trans-L-3-hydroxyproline dehydratase
MYGCIPVEPTTPDGDIGVLFLHNEGYSTMCGHGIIGLVKVGLETGLIKPRSNPNRVNIDTPAGRVTAEAVIINGIVEEVSFINVPSFVYASDLETWVQDFGVIHVDIAYGGAFYAFVDAGYFGFKLEPNEIQELIKTGRNIKEAVIRSTEIKHPFDNDLSFLYGTIFTGRSKDPSHHSRNVCIFADGEVDRCPTGTGVSARAAIHFKRGEIRVNQPLLIESIIDTCFKVEVTAGVNFGPYQAVMPRVTGSAHITGRNEWFINPIDPLKYGFFLR